jgi:hypothetical protein
MRVVLKSLFLSLTTFAVLPAWHSCYGQDSTIATEPAQSSPTTTTGQLARSQLLRLPAPIPVHNGQRSRDQAQQPLRPRSTTPLMRVKWTTISITHREGWLTGMSTAGHTSLQPQRQYPVLPDPAPIRVLKTGSPRRHNASDRSRQSGIKQIVS